MRFTGNTRPYNRGGAIVPLEAASRVTYEVAVIVRFRDQKGLLEADRKKNIATDSNGADLRRSALWPTNPSFAKAA
jgi:hypothetical protein